FIIAGLIFVLGLIAQSRGTEPASVLGFRGTSGAIQFLLMCAAAFGGVIGGLLGVAGVAGPKRLLRPLFFGLPGRARVPEAFARARFSIALEVTMDTALAIARALRLSLQATGNAAFVDRTPPIVEAVKSGEELTVALSRGQVFPADFLNMVAVGEEGGKLV